MRIMSLKESQRQFGELESIQVIGETVGLTDLALILGGGDDTWLSASGKQTGDVWTSTSNGYGLLYTMQQDANTRERNPRCRNVATRPVLDKLELSLIKQENKRFWRPLDTIKHHPNERAQFDKTIELFDYGEYPQNIVSDDIFSQLENLYQKKKLSETGACFTFDRKTSEKEAFMPIQYLEYEYNGKRYVRVDRRDRYGSVTLSSGKKLEEDKNRGTWNVEKQCWEKDPSISSKSYWLEVKPITWVKDPSGIAYTLDAIVAGFQYNFDGYIDDFYKTDLFQHLQNFQREIIQPRNHTPKSRNLSLEGLKRSENVK